MRTACAIGSLIIGVGVTWSPLAMDKDQVASKKQTRAELYLNSTEAYEFVTRQPDRALFLDIRSRAEVNFLGMPTAVDANVPYEYFSANHEWDARKQRFKMERNPRFASEVISRLTAKGLTKHDPVILICRSGKRSAHATDFLTSLGFTQVFTVVDGYEGDQAQEGPRAGQRIVNGWKNAGLPWTYQLEREMLFVRAAHPLSNSRMAKAPIR